MNDEAYRLIEIFYLIKTDKELLERFKTGDLTDKLSIMLKLSMKNERIPFTTLLSDSTLVMKIIDLNDSLDIL